MISKVIEGEAINIHDCKMNVGMAVYFQHIICSCGENAHTNLI